MLSSTDEKQTFNQEEEAPDSPQLKVASASQLPSIPPEQLTGSPYYRPDSFAEASHSLQSSRIRKVNVIDVRTPAGSPLMEPSLVPHPPPFTPLSEMGSKHLPGQLPVGKISSSSSPTGTAPLSSHSSTINGEASPNTSESEQKGVQAGNNLPSNEASHQLERNNQAGPSRQQDQGDENQNANKSLQQNKNSGEIGEPNNNRVDKNVQFVEEQGSAEAGEPRMNSILKQLGRSRQFVKEIVSPEARPVAPTPNQRAQALQLSPAHDIMGEMRKLNEEIQTLMHQVQTAANHTSRQEESKRLEAKRARVAQLEKIHAYRSRRWSDGLYNNVVGFLHPLAAPLNHTPYAGKSVNDFYRIHDDDNKLGFRIFHHADTGDFKGCSIIDLPKDPHLALAQLKKDQGDWAYLADKANKNLVIKSDHPVVVNYLTLELKIRHGCTVDSDHVRPGANEKAEPGWYERIGQVFHTNTWFNKNYTNDCVIGAVGALDAIYRDISKNLSQDAGSASRSLTPAQEEFINGLRPLLLKNIHIEDIATASIEQLFTCFTSKQYLEKMDRHDRKTLLANCMENPELISYLHDYHKKTPVPAKTIISNEVELHGNADTGRSTTHSRKSPLLG